MAIHKVLIVDDARPDLMNLEKIVSGAGYTTITATNGQQAVEMSKSQMPDVILMDVNMDQMDGFAATRAIGGDAVHQGAFRWCWSPARARRPTACGRRCSA